MFYELVFLIFFLQNVLSQTPAANEQKGLQINVPDTGRIDTDGGMVYYKLVITQNVAVNTTNLAIRVKENDAADTGGDDFSDPDIYVSKTNSNPSNPETSTWYSERFGEDLINIPKSQVSSDQVFYLGVYCERKCKYEILARFENDVEIKEGDLFQAFIKKEESVVFQFHAKAGYSDLEFVAFSEGLGYFRIYVGKNQMPTSQNTILAIPSWAGGYSVNINNGTEDYCENCIYYIVIEAPIYDTHVFLFAKYESTVTLMRSIEPVFSSLRPFKTHCYKIIIDEGRKNENLILQVALFSGTATLRVQPWSLPGKDADEFIIRSERVIKYSPAERKEGNNVETGEFFYCLNTNEFTSYILKATFESQIEEGQRFNVLYRGKEIDGYVPSEKALRYRILDFEAKSNLTITLNVKSGDPKLYGYICENIKLCKFTKSRVQQELLDNKMIMSQEYSIGYVLTINDTVNTCHQNLAKNDTMDTISENLRCAVLAVVVCEGNEDCEYTIRTTRDNYVVQLQPRKPHYKILPLNEQDLYSIKIEDEKISTLNIILNTITGDADMKVYFTEINNTTGYPTGVSPPAELVGVSENEPYIPDVIRVNADTLRRPNIMGMYNITVIGSSFSSYSLYYYTIRKSEPINISMDLQTGYIIRDIFKKETKYKIYSYNPRMKDPLDIRVTITPEVSQYTIYAFFDINDLKYNEGNSWDPISGYKWRSWRSNELVISKNDKEFKQDEIYYFVVARTYSLTSLDSSNATPSFFIGVTNEFYPFLLYEGIPQLVTLTENFNSQTYWYTHPNISNPFSLSVNIYYGKVNVYADFGEIRNMTNSTLKEREFPIKSLDLGDAAMLVISPDVMKTHCGGNNCGIFIRVDRASIFDAQYLLVAKSHPSKPEALSAGVLRTESVEPGDVKKFSILLEKKTNSVIFVHFLSGLVEAYVNVRTQIQNIIKADYPTTEKADYVAKDTMFGKVLNLDNKVFDNCDPCQVLISVYGRNLGWAETAIVFSIAYYDSARRLNQNQPLKSHIKQGEFQFYKVFIGSANNIFVSLSNMDGDADIYMNYGNTFPTFENSTWSSNSLSNEFINIDNNDNYFVTNKINDISGEYTILLYGFSNSTYTLFVTDHQKKIQNVDDDVASCKAKAGESCFFRYNIDTSYGYAYFKNFQDYILTTDFLYGSGAIYVRLYSSNDYDIIKDFPSESFNDFNSIKSNSRNLLKFHYDGNDTRLTNNSMLLITVECKEDSFFDLNMLQWFDSDIQYLNLYRENIFYIYKSQKMTYLVYYNMKAKDLNYNFYTYEGKGKVKVYSNETNWGEIKSYNVTEIDSFYIDSSNSYEQSITSTISTKDYEITNKSIYFSVEPERDLGFYVKLTHNEDFNKLKIGKVNPLVINNNSPKFYGFFDMLEDYEYTIITLTSDNPQAIVYMHVKYAFVDKAATQNINHHNYTFPDNGNADITGNTDQILSSVSLKVVNPKSLDETEKRYIRVLISLELQDFSVNRTDTKVSLTISPSTNGMSKVEAVQNQYIFSEFKGIDKDVKIYDLTKKNINDDLLVIEMSSCSGDFNFRISDRMNFGKKDIHSIDHYEDVSGGRKLVKVKLANLDSDNFFLTLSAKESGGKDCYYSRNKTYICDDKTEAMFYYFTTTEESYKKSFANGKGTIEVQTLNDDSFSLKWKQILTESRDNSLETAQVNYTLFISDNILDFNHMESVCYLSKMKQNITNYDIKLGNEWAEATVRSLDKNKRYFVNVLARNLDDNDVIAFQPVEILLKSVSIPIYLIVLPIIAVLVLGYLVYYFYKKFKVTKQILNYEINDVRNMSSVPKSLNELADMAKVSNRQRYANLTEENSI